MIRSIARSSVFLVAILGLLGVAAACGGGAADNASTSSRDISPSIAATSKDVGAPASSGAISAATAVSASGSSQSSTSTTSWDRKIIRNADISLQVTSVESMLATIRTITDSAGGVVFASSTSYDGDKQIATMTLDVPAEQFDQVVNALRSAPDVKKVARESITSQDVTDQYVDLQSQLRNLQSTETRLLALMDTATQLQDILTLDQELSKIQGQIDQTTGRINYLDKHTSYSRITLTLSPVAAPSPVRVESGTNLKQAVHDAWRASLRFTGGVLTGVVKAAVFLWWFWPLALIAIGFVAVRRQQRRVNGSSENIA